MIDELIPYFGTLHN